MASVFRLSLATGFICFALAGACGHVGLETRLDDQESVTAAGGDSAGDGDGDIGGTGGDGTGGEATGGDGAGGIGTGGDGTGGRPLFGGFGGQGLGGSFGTFEEPESPCSENCDEPVLLYETFEEGLPEVVQEDGGGAVSVSQEFPYYGDSAFSASQGEPGSFARITQGIPRVVGGQLYLRAWIFVPEDAAVDTLTLFTFNGANDGGLEYVLLSDGTLKIEFPSTGTHAISDASIPRGEWFCLRSRAFVDNVNGEVDVWVDGERMVSAQGWDTLPGAEIDRISYGIIDTSGEQTGAVVRLDELAAARVPIPCAPRW